MTLLSQCSKEFNHAIMIAARITKRGWRLVSICQGDDVGQTWWFVFFEIPNHTSTREVAEIVSGEGLRVGPPPAGRDAGEPTPGPWRVGKGGTVISDSDPTDGADTGHGGPSALQYYGGNLIAESIWRRADACLMAASWELFEACKAVAKCCGGHENWNGETEQFLLLVEAALAKSLDPKTLTQKPKEEDHD